MASEQLPDAPIGTGCVMLLVFLTALQAGSLGFLLGGILFLLGCSVIDELEFSSEETRAAIGLVLAGSILAGWLIA